MFEHAAQWILQQAGYVIVAGVVVIGIISLLQRRITALIGSVLIGGILAMFCFGGTGTMQHLASIFQGVFGL